jgi:hypothetical protein
MDKTEFVERYRRVKKLEVELKAEILAVVCSKEGGCSNKEIGQSVGLYAGYYGSQKGERQDGHITCQLLHDLENEGLIVQDKTTADTLGRGGLWKPNFGFATIHAGKETPR